MTDNLLAQVRAHCLSLPNATEELTWGHPTFRIGGKIFATSGAGADGRASCGCKTSREHQAVLVQRPGFSVADYVGRYGWVTIELDGSVEISEIRALITDSWRQIAPRRLVKAFDARA